MEDNMFCCNISHTGDVYHYMGLLFIRFNDV